MHLWCSSCWMFLCVKGTCLSVLAVWFLSLHDAHIMLMLIHLQKRDIIQGRNLRVTALSLSDCCTFCRSNFLITLMIVLSVYGNMQWARFSNLWEIWYYQNEKPGSFLALKRSRKIAQSCTYFKVEFTSGLPLSPQVGLKLCSFLFAHHRFIHLVTSSIHVLAGVPSWEGCGNRY